MKRIHWQAVATKLSKYRSPESYKRLVAAYTCSPGHTDWKGVAEELKDGMEPRSYKKLIEKNTIPARTASLE